MKDKVIDILLRVVMKLLILLMVGVAALYIWALIKYGGKPISEVPTWVWWLLRSGK